MYKNIKLLALSFFLLPHVVSAAVCIGVSPEPFLADHMEFGNAATVFVPQDPDCATVPFNPNNTMEYRWSVDGVLKQVSASPNFNYNPPSPGRYVINVLYGEVGDCLPGACNGGFQGKSLVFGRTPTTGASFTSACTIFNNITGERRASVFSTGVDPDSGEPSNLQYFWQTVSGSGGVSGGPEATFKSFNKGDSTISHFTRHLVANSNFPSIPVEIAINCPNQVPSIISASGNVINGGAELFATVNDPDTEPSIQYSWSVDTGSLPTPPEGVTLEYSISPGAGSVVPSLADKRKSIPKNTFTTNVAGQYTFILTTTDSDGVSDTETVSVNVTFVPQAKFKISLNGDEYLFQDCAPYNDQCKNLASAFEGGEFLIGDEITLDASETSVPGSGTTTYGWQIKNLTDNSITTLSGQQTSYQIPTVSESDYEVSLVATRGANSLSKVKKFKARQAIEIPFQDDGEPTADRPYPFYYQADYGNSANKWHRNGGEGALIKDAGCTVTSLSMLADIKAATKKFDPPAFNKYLASAPYKAFNKKNDILWAPTVNALNSISGDPVQFSYADPYTQVGREQLVKLARKRKLMIIRVHSRSHEPDADHNDPIFNNASWAKKCRKANSSIQSCHQGHKHFMVVRGVEYFPGNGIRVVVADPGFKNQKTVSLDHTRASNQGYDSDNKGLAVFTPMVSTLVKSRATASIAASLTDFSEDALLVDPLGRRLGIDPSSGLEYNEIPNGVFEYSGLAKDGESADGESLSDGLDFRLSHQSGVYQIFAKVPDTSIIKGSANLLASNGFVAATKFFQASGSPGAIAQLSFSLQGGSLFKGDLSITHSRYRKRSSSTLDEEEVRGIFTLAPGSDGLNLGGEDFTFSLDFQGDTLSAGSFQRLGSSWVYYYPQRKNGIYDARVSDDGSFSVKTRGFSNQEFISGSEINVSLQIGNDLLEAESRVLSSVKKEFLRLVPEYLSYSVGARAKVVIQILSQAENAAMEIVGALYVNGEEVLPLVQHPNRLEYSLPINAAGALDLEARAYLQDKREARAYLEALKSNRLERDKIRARLEDGVNEDQRQELEARLGDLERQIQAVKEKLATVRKEIGERAVERIYAQ